jgi:uncharacterized protein (TIGR02453 family)
MTAIFSKGLFTFLAELEQHNERDWFNANKARYETEVRDPMLRFIGELSGRLGKVSPYFVADPRPVGGSMMRIYRDIRFSKDKTPYRTSAMAHFGHDEAGDGAAPGFWLHLEPKASSLGVGLWGPDSAALKNLRQAIVDRDGEWTKATRGKKLGSDCSFAGESLKRPPPGFDPDHPLIEDLKRKDFALTLKLADADVVKPGFVGEVIDGFSSLAPFAKFVTKAVGLRF